MKATWEEFFKEIQNEPFYVEMNKFIEDIYSNSIVYPKKEDVFNTFRLCPLENVKVIIIGQDPYHEPNQAMGLAFSVPDGVKLPPSLKNIYKEIESETGEMMNFYSGDLTYLAEQGVFLINSYLTVEKGKPLSHKKDFYIDFLKHLISYLEKKNRGYVYLLWGNFSHQFADLIYQKDSLVIKTSHPSPLAMRNGNFFGSNQFNKANEHLGKLNKHPIKWTNI